MAYDGSSQGPYSGRPQFQLYVYVRREQTDVANNRATYAYEIRALNPEGQSSSYYLDPVGGVITFDPGNPAADRPWSHNLDFRAGQSYIVLASGNTGWFNHDGNGNLQINWAAAHGPIGQFGTGYTSGSMQADRIPRQPYPPGTPTFSNITPSNIRVSVSPPNNNGATIDAYDFQFSVNSNMSGATTRNHNGPTLDISGLAAGTTYYFRVRAHNAAGWGDWSPIASASTSTSPSAVRSCRLNGTPTTTSIPVAWTAPTSDGGTPLTGYQVQRATNSAFTTGLSTTTVSGTSTSTTLSGLSPATNYWVRVRALNAVGFGPWSNVLATATAATTVTNTTGLSASAETTILAQWTSSNGNATTGFDIQYATNSPFSGATTRTAAASASALLLTGLTPATKYWVRIRAKTAAGAGAWSSAVTQVTVPAQISFTQFTDITPTTIRAWWSKGSNGSELNRYELQYSTSSNMSGATTINNGLTLNRLVSSLTPGTTYYFRVRAVNTSGVAGLWSAVSSRATPASTAPGLTVTAAADGRSATARMTPPGNTGTVNSYEVQYRIGSSGVITTRTTTSSTLTVTGLTPGTTYQWRARAVIGTYSSPYTAWQSLVQPNPSTDPGDYFDGSTLPKSQTSYRWTGTVNNSTSEAVGGIPIGWASSTGLSGGVARMMRDVGGRTQPYCARVNILADTTAPGLLAGQNIATEFKTPVGEGGTYYAMIHIRIPFARTQRMQLQLNWYQANGASAGISYGPEVVVGETQNGWVRLTASDVAPPGAAFATVRARDVSGTGWSPWLSGEYFMVDDMFLSLTPGTGYFDGQTKDTPDYQYDWTGTANSSSSIRTAVENISDALADPDCPPAPTPPRPPAITDDCIEDETQWRRYWTAVDKVLVESHLESVPIVRVAATAASRLVRVRYYRNPLDLPLEEIDPADFFAEQLISYIPAGVTYILDGTLQRMWADFGDGTLLPADHLLYGQGGESPSWPVFSGGISHYVTVDVPLDSPDDSITVDFDLILRY